MPTYDSTKKEILVTDSNGVLHRYLKGNPSSHALQPDAVIAVMTGKIEWKSGNLQDGMEPDKLPQKIIVAQDIDGLRLFYEWFLDESP